MAERRVCKERGCEIEAAPRRQVCEEDWLLKQPPVVRAEFAQRRLSLVPEEFRQAKVHDSKWPPGRRFCAGCQTFVRLQDCAGSRCKACASIASHRSRTKQVYGIDDSTWQWLLDKQLGRCAICRRLPQTARFAVDHDHRHEACGGKACRDCVRGLLCKRCNDDLLTAAKHEPQTLLNAVRYLTNPPMREGWTPPAEEIEAWNANHPDEDPPPF